MRTDLLSGLVVTEFGGTTPAARFCGKALADLGATVFEAEPVPAGFPTGQAIYLEHGKHGGVAGDLPEAVIIGAIRGRPRDAG
ncbi:MAG: CoA transferase, partial [Dehalococcoidia bacterium]|nr:CoA transferase [Dehalococcoidia bacterium]